MDNLKRALLFASILIFITGCTGNYGTISRQNKHAEKITIEGLTENWDDYDIYYGTRDGRWADALMFDPRGDDKKLTGDSWIRIEDKAALSNSIDKINSVYGRLGVHIIKGPDKQIFGYMYYSSDLHIPVKTVGEKALYVRKPPNSHSRP